MTISLTPLALAAALATAPQATPPQGGGVQAVALAQVEILAPVTNATSAPAAAPVRVISRTRDDRYFVEYQ